MRTICFCGVGALGSRIAMELASTDFHFRLIDDDKVEAENIGPSIYFVEHIGQFKVSALAELLYRKNYVHAGTIRKTMDVSTAGLMLPSDLIIDTFDNPKSRRLTITTLSDVVHIGVGEGDVGNVMWDNVYTPPEITFERGHNPICTNMLSRQLIQFTASVAVGSILSYFETGHKDSYIIRSTMEIIKV